MSLNKRINFVMSTSYNNKTNNGYLYSIQKGIESDFFGQVSSLGKDISRKEKIKFLKEELRGSLIQGNDLQNISLILRKRMELKIYIPEDFITLKTKKLFGLGGQDIFITTDILIPLNLYIKNFLNW